MSPIRSALISLAAIALCSSCQPIEGSGRVLTVERPLGLFTRVHVEDSLSVRIVRGEPKLTITADENLIGRIESDIDGETLELRMKDERGVLATFAHLELSSELLRGLEVTNASQVSAEATQAAEWRLDVSGGSICELTNLSADEFILDVSGESQVDVSGLAARVNLDVGNQSRANTDGLETPDAVVDVSGASTLNVRATRSIDLESSGNSRVFVSGNPTQREIDADYGSLIEFVSEQ